MSYWTGAIHTRVLAWEISVIIQVEKGRPMVIGWEFLWDCVGIRAASPGCVPTFAMLLV